MAMCLKLKSAGIDINIQKTSKDIYASTLPHCGHTAPTLQLFNLLGPELGPSRPVPP